MKFKAILSWRTFRRSILLLCLALVSVAVVTPDCEAQRRSRRKQMSEKEIKKLRRRMEREYLGKCPQGTEATGQLPPDGNKFYCMVPTRKKGMVRHGEYNHWFTNGKKRQQGEYYMGKRHGVWKTYRRDGTVKFEEVYYDGKAQSKKTYDRDGNATEQVDNNARRRERRKKHLWRHGGRR